MTTEKFVYNQFFDELNSLNRGFELKVRLLRVNQTLEQKFEYLFKFDLFYNNLILKVKDI